MKISPRLGSQFVGVLTLLELLYLSICGIRMKKKTTTENLRQSVLSLDLKQYE